MSFAHGGNVRELARLAGCRPDDLLDFSANINPLGPPEGLRPVISRALEEVIHYPDPNCTVLARALAEKHGTKPEQVVVGNGSTELLYALPQALGARRVVVPEPAYRDYSRAGELAGLPVEQVLPDDIALLKPNLTELSARLARGDMVFLGQPGNPIGQLADSACLLSLCDKNAHAFFVVDEAFADFVERFESLIQAGRPNLVVVRSMTKFYALPGLRLGYVLAPAPLAESLRRRLPPWSVNTPAQAAGVAVLTDKEYAKQTRESVARWRDQLRARLLNLSGLHVYPGVANYLLVRVDRMGLDARGLAARLLDRRIAVRVCDDYPGLDARFFRIAVRTENENERLCDAIAEVLSGTQRGGVRTRKPPALMFQGTSSSAGKSILSAALCRILLQDGFRVAPFKAQNMSLNSFVTRGGGEMGRAQVVQAQACRLEPDVRMNPVLLKPNTDTGAQVIVLGRPVGNMETGAYFRHKARLFEQVKEAYDSLASEVDIMVLEGAGSPGEVNLKSHDIVNMRMAEHAGARVLVVGDIDRGGVFASFVGTMEVLAEWERAQVAGFVVNRFRGQESLLGDAPDYVLRHTGRPVLGVVPYIHELGLPEEDSVAFKNGAFDDSGAADAAVDIVVLDLPHISNFTDFDALRTEPDARVRVVRHVARLGSPDAVILPGSKNIMGDLEYLRAGGFADRLQELAHEGRTELVGICGGFQVLGGDIADPHGLESNTSATRGLGLLPVVTTLELDKTLKCVGARHVPSGLPVRGYEIHHGRSAMENGRVVVERDDGAPLGVASPSGLVWGTYLHGVFDADEFRRWFIDRLRVRKGLMALGASGAKYDMEPALDRLAGIVRSALRMNEIYRMLALPQP